MSVVVVDLDLQFGDVASGLLLEPEHTLADAVTGAAVQDSMGERLKLAIYRRDFHRASSLTTWSQ